ncbi:MAG: hypothetical protein ACO3JL_15945 [Myxococcota bacterium]
MMSAWRRVTNDAGSEREKATEAVYPASDLNPSGAGIGDMARAPDRKTVNDKSLTHAAELTVQEWMTPERLPKLRGGRRPRLPGRSGLPGLISVIPSAIDADHDLSPQVRQ